MSIQTNSEEDRLVNQHESTKATIEQDLSSEVALRAEQSAHKDTTAVDELAEKAKDRAVKDVRGAAHTSARRQGIARSVQIVDFLFCAVYVLLAVRLVLGMIAANSTSGFVKFIDTLTNPFYAFFKGIVSSPASGGYTLVLPIIVAIGAYALLHWGVRSLAKLIAYRQSEV